MLEHLKDGSVIVSSILITEVANVLKFEDASSLLKDYFAYFGVFLYSLRYSLHAFSWVAT